MTNFSARMKRFRKQTGMTQKQLADAAGCAECTISRLENGLEFPNKYIFEKLVNKFETEGYSYEDLVLEESKNLQKSKEKLFVSIQDEKEAELERQIEKFRELMCEESIENHQWLIVAQLCWLLHMGLPREEFLEGCINAFELTQKLPKAKDTKDTNLTKIEHVILEQMSITYIAKNEDEKAADFLTGLLVAIQKHTSRSLFFKRHSANICNNLSRAFVKRNQLDKAAECCNYVFASTLESFNMKMILQALKTKALIMEKDGKAKEADEIVSYVKIMEKLALTMGAKEMFLEAILEEYDESSLL